MPSRGDAFGRVTAESLAHGRAVIGAKAGATPELISHRYNGLLFDAGDSEALAKEIEVVARNPRLLAELGTNAARTAWEEFSIEKHVESVVSVYQDVLAPIDPVRRQSFELSVER
jgi:glycosyltransferase involved in cell wall biosynthesis